MPLDLFVGNVGFPAGELFGFLDLLAGKGHGFDLGIIQRSGEDDGEVLRHAGDGQRLAIAIDDLPPGGRDAQHIGAREPFREPRGLQVFGLG